METVQSVAAAHEHTGLLPGPGRYRHFKGGEYVLIGVARHTETQELLAVYRPADSDVVWVRPLPMFVEEVSLGDKSIPRFQRVA